MARMKVEMSKREFAQFLGVREQIITIWENASRPVYLSIMPKYISILGYNPFVDESLTDTPSRLRAYLTRSEEGLFGLSQKCGISVFTLKEIMRASRAKVSRETLEKLDRFLDTSKP